MTFTPFSRTFAARSATGPTVRYSVAAFASRVSPVSSRARGGAASTGADSRPRE